MVIPFIFKGDCFFFGLFETSEQDGFLFYFSFLLQLSFYIMNNIWLIFLQKELAKQHLKHLGNPSNFFWIFSARLAHLSRSSNNASTSHYQQVSAESIFLSTWWALVRIHPNGKPIPWKDYTNRGGFKRGSVWFIWCSKTVVIELNHGRDTVDA